MAVAALVPRTPEEVEVVEVETHIVPATVAGVVVDDAVWRGEFVGRMGKSGDHHHRNSAPPRQPAQAGREADKEIRVFDEIDPFLQRLVPGFILDAPRHMIPDQSRAMNTFLVDADHPVAVFL